MAGSFPQSGQIDPSGFPFLIVDLQRTSATGTLTVEGPTHKKQIYFRGGRILFGSSNDPRDQLGAILIESGKLTSAQLDEATRKVGPGNPLAKVLSENGLVTQRELSDAARSKVERILADVFAYSDARYEFEDGVLPKGAVDLKLSTNRLVVAAARRAPDPVFVERHLGGSDVVLSPTAELAARLADVQSETAGLESFLDGMHSLAETAALAGVDEDTAGRVACGLLFLGALERAAGEPVVVDEEPVTTIDIGEAGTMPFESATASGGELNITMPAPTPGPEPTVVLPSHSSAPPPLRVIAPPAAADRTRPPTKPTQADLAALDSLLASKAPEGPLAPLSKAPEENWQPQFLKSGGRRNRSSSGGARRKVLYGVAAVVTLAIVGFLVYLYLPTGSGPAQATPAPAAPGTASAQTPPAAAALPAASPAASPLTSPPADGAAAATAAPPVAPSATAAPKTPPTTPALVTSPVPVATPPPSKAGSLAAPAPAAAPSAKTGVSPAVKPAPSTAASKPAPAGPAAAFSAAHARLRKGEFAEAAHDFTSSVKPGSFTIQLLVACSTETLQKAAGAVSAQEWFVVPARYKGKECFRICWGVFESEAAAKAAQKDVAEYFRTGGASPKVVPTAQILK
jgi:hypothetical protein